MRNVRLQKMLEAALMAALAMILDLLPSIRLGPGISISFAMVPVFLIAYRRGVGTGLVTGFLWSLLQVVTGDAYFVHPVQFILDYPLAFTAIGLAGIFSRQVKENLLAGEKKKGLAFAVAGTFAGSAARYFFHFFSGMIWFADAAPEGWPAWFYSLVANGITCIGASVLCVLILSFLLSIGSQLLKTNEA